MLIFLTVRKHKNTIIFLQRFRKHAEFTNCFSRKQCYSQLFCFEICVLGWNICVIPPTSSLPNSISTPLVPSSVICQKMKHIVAMESCKQTGPEIADSTQLKNPWHPAKKLSIIKHWCSAKVSWFIQATSWDGYELVYFANIKNFANVYIRQCKACHFTLSIALVLQSGTPCKCWVWGVGGGRINSL